MTAPGAAAASGQGASLRLLLEAGADPQWQDENGRSLLMLAATRGDIETLSLLHEAGAAADHRDRAGHSALTLAAANSIADTVAWLLLNANVDIDHQAGAQQRSALQLAAAAGHDDVIALLLLMDVDVNAVDASGQTALQLATTCRP